MPELPEVETVVRTLRPAIVGRRILNAEFKQLRVLIGDPIVTAQALVGRKVKSIERHGKFIAIRLDRGYLVIHLGMTGRLLVDGALSKWTHAIFTLDRGVLLYEDPRQFGRIEYGDELPARVAALGPEPLEVTLEEFARRLKLRRSPIKAVLLNQAAVREVLAEAIESRGSSISNYVDAEGNRGGFQNAHRVYQRTDEPCLNCGAP